MSEDIAVRIVWKVCKSLYVRVECQILIMRNWVGGVLGSPPPLHPIPSQLPIWMLSPEIKSWLGSAPWSWGMYTHSSCFQLSFYLKVYFIQLSESDYHNAKYIINICKLRVYIIIVFQKYTLFTSPILIPEKWKLYSILKLKVISKQTRDIWSLVRSVYVYS